MSRIFIDGLARCLIGALLLASAQAFAADTIVPHVATYKVKISIASGTLTSVVRESGDGYFVQSRIEPKGLAGLLTSGDIVESSLFVVNDDGVRPQIYSSDDGISRDKTKMDFVFDWDAQRVSGTVNGEQYEYPLDNDFHDRVSIQYALMHDLMADTPTAEYVLMDGDELKQLEISNIGKKRIKVPLGSFDAVGIQHQAAGSKRITTLWCAEELGFLPVLIEQRRKGKVKVRAVLAEYDPGVPGETTVSPAVTASQ